MTVRQPSDSEPGSCPSAGRPALGGDHVVRSGLALDPCHLVGGGGVARTLVGERDLQALVEERVLLEPGTERLEVVLGGLEDRPVGPERLGGAGALVGTERLQPVDAGDRVAAVRVLLAPVVPVAAYLGDEAVTQCVDHGHADTVQPAGDGVAATTELAAGMQDRHDHLEGGLALGRVHRDRDASAIVGDAYAAVGHEPHVDLGGVARKGFVHSVIHNLVHKVVEPTLTGRSDIHARSLTNGLETFQDCDVPGVVAAVDSLCHGRGCSSSFRHTMCTTTDVPAAARAARTHKGPCRARVLTYDPTARRCSAFRASGRSWDPARLTPSYYLLSGENPGSGAVCSHSSTTFLHRVIFALLEGFREGRKVLGRSPDRPSGRRRGIPLGGDPYRCSSPTVRTLQIAREASCLGLPKVS